VDANEEWDRIFSGLNEETAGKDPWLERWRRLLEASRGSPVLDLGCGAGQDARFLTELGFAVIAADFSEEALKLTHLTHVRPPRKRRTWTSPAACCPSPTPISE
jgi:SAM-dependent methyltransferase